MTNPTGSILLRRGPTVDRLSFVPLDGEIIYDSDLKQVFVGDGETYGGRSAGDINDLPNARQLKFFELETNGENFVAISAPDSVLANYSLKFPQGAGTDGNLLGLGANGQLEFVNPDIYGGNSVYVSVANGDDANDGVSKPVRTLKRALQIASGKVYSANGTINGRKIAVNVAAGEYYENNPLIVPDNVTVRGASLRACNIRPLNPNKDMLRVRNASYFSEFTFRDALDANRIPVSTFDYAVSFDNPADTSTSRVGYTYLPTSKPVIDTSPYIQNCSIISFLGGNGCLVDGNLVVTPNVPKNQIQVENPVDGPAPEQGHSMVANAFTMLTFGGTAWRVINDAYIQIVSCFQIFALNGTYCQSGGYASITNSATNFGIYALRASGYSRNAFAFDKGYIAATGVSNSLQSFTAIGFGRPPTQDYVVRFRDPTYRYAYDLLQAGKNSIISQTSTWIDLQIATDTAPFIGYNYSGSNRVKGERDIGLVIDAVASDILTGGNSYSVAAGLSYQNLATGIYAISAASVTYAKGLAQTALTSLTGKGTLAGTYFDIVISAINDPAGAPEAVPYTSATDITTSFISQSASVAFDAAADVNVTNNVFTIASHGFRNGDAIIYDSGTGTQISGLFDEQTYYVVYLDEDNFTLSFDDSLTRDINILAVGSGTHYFIRSLQEFFVKDLVSSHNSYQTLTLAPGTYSFVPGTAITGTTSGNPNEAYVYSYNSVTRELVVSLNQVIVNANIIRNPFSTGSTIITNNNAVSNITVTDTASRSDLYSGTFTVVGTTTGSLIGNLLQLPTKQVWLHRPSIVNSSGHTWEYAGSGIDYNALPQNGGQSRFEFEQYSDLPGRVYSSGTNELGDFKVGNFIKAENRTGNVSFTNKVSVAQLDALRLSVGDIVIDFISADIGLGDNEAGGASNSRLTTQLAIRSFLSNRLGNFIDKSVSTNAVPGSVIQLNSSGQINVDLLPAVRNFNSAKANGYNSRLALLEEVPATDLLNGDIVSETYSTVQLTLSGTITASAGALVTQANTGASGYLTTDISASNIITVASFGTVNGQLFNINFNTTAANVLTVAGTVTTRYPTAVGTALTGNTANYVLIDSNDGQYLILPPTGTYSFTVNNVITSANDLIQGRITSTRYGVVKTVDAATYVAGSGYNPASGTTIYSFVPLTNGSGSGAIADITISNGSVVNIDMRRGGTGYLVGDLLSVNAASVGGAVTVPCSFPVTSVENRLYVDLLSGTKFTATSASPNFIADNNASSTTLSLASTRAISFSATSTNVGGAVDSDGDTLTISSHSLTNGDPITYSSGVNVALGGLTSGNVYYAKVINSNVIQLYKEYSLSTLINITNSGTGTHSLTVSAVNVTGNVIHFLSHPYVTGDCLQLLGTSLPAIDGLPSVSGNFYFTGSVTTNSFTLHTSRSDALASVNGLATLPINFTTTGTGDATLKKQNVFIYGVVNTSSTNPDNWSPLSTSTIDAGSIISGVVGTTRLASGTANSTTFLRGDQSWNTVAQSIKKATGSPISPTGSFTTVGSDNLYYGDITLDVDKVSGNQGDDTYTNLGVAKFLKAQFDVGSASTPLKPPGQVFIKSGVIDAGTLQTYNADYFLNPSNLSKAVPVNKGGTALSSYTVGDMLYASATAAFSKLNIGSAGQVLIVADNGVAPVWSNSLSLPGNLTVGGNVTFNGLNSTLNVNALSVDDNNIEIGSVGVTTGLSATIVLGNFTVTLASTTGLIPGMTITKTSGTGNFGLNPVISSVDSRTQITLNVVHTTSGAVQFTAGTATDDTAAGGGITLKGTTNKTLSWVKANTAWTSSENFDLVTGKTYKVNGTDVLSGSTLGTGVTSSSLTTVGTIATGVWQGTAVGAIYGGTGLTSYAKGDIIYASASNTLSVLAKPTETAILQIDADGTPTWNKLSSANAGTVTSGTWNGSVILGTYGGTGVANTGKTITLGGNLTTTSPNVSPGSFVVGQSYVINSFGTTNNAQWNEIAGTAGVTYSVGSSFTAAVIGTNLGNGTAKGVFATSISATAATAVTLPTSGKLVGSADTGTVTNTMLANSTISGRALGTNLNALTISTGLSGTSYNGSTAVTLTIDDTVVTKTGTQSLTNKTFEDSTTYFADNSDSSKKFQFDASGITKDFVRTFTVPDHDGNIITTGDSGTVTNAMLEGSISNDKITNNKITINGNDVSLGGSLTVTANAPNALTIGTGLSGTSYNGSAAVTIAVDSTVVVTSGAQTIAGVKTFSSTIIGSINGNSGTSTKLATARSIAMTGDVTWSITSFDGSANVTADGTLATVNTNIGTFNNVTVNAKGLVTSASSTTYALPADVHYVGTTSIALNRASAAQSLTGINGFTSGAAMNIQVLAMPTNNVEGYAGTIIGSSTKGTGTGGQITIRGGAASVNESAVGTGGAVLIAGGSGSSNRDAGGSLLGSGGNGGTTTIRGGFTDTGGQPGSIEYSGGVGTGDGGALTIKAGQAQGANKAGGLVKISAGVSTGNSSASAIEFYTTPAGVSSSNEGTSTKRFEILSTGQIKASADISASNKTTGTLVVTGGVGVSGSVYANELYDNGNRVVTGTPWTSVGYLTANQSISLTGAVTGTGTTSIETTLKDSGVTAGTYNNVTVDAKGIVTGGSNTAYVTGTPWTSVGYLTSYTETDTLQSVTSRTNGASTTVDCTFPTITATSLSAIAGGSTISGSWTLNAGAKFQATYADLAEKYVADAAYEPGTVLDLGGNFEVTAASMKSRRIAGVVSTNPAYVLNTDCKGEHVVEMALQGRVPCKVKGTIRKGDMLVSYGNGYACADENPVLGSVIGKAMENFDGEEGVIEILIGRM